MNPIKVGPSKFGLGVFANRNLDIGEKILEFKGETVHLDVAKNVPMDRFGDPLQIGSKTYLLLEEPCRLINHSCDPNAGLTNALELIAVKAILAGEEVFFDYSTTMGDRMWQMPCSCGTQKCRKVVTDFSCLPLEIREKYISLGVVQNYLLK